MAHNFEDEKLFPLIIKVDHLDELVEVIATESSNNEEFFCKSF